eukprot:CAMPEP_0198696526 /NCGR_PEP_ID=MMETSP1468-20131203/308341_1 /TAXON_ID=1461545 /ORGANISM="Mantoniella sp, Strain CCMP1436" /LENGTH=61 /DNA_ID=CAMNT_0044452833 /DNA_START=86 /DNA_END=268 /DNA_ORIENTATION=-
MTFVAPPSRQQRQQLTHFFDKASMPTVDADGFRSAQSTVAVRTRATRWRVWRQRRRHGAYT